MNKKILFHSGIVSAVTFFAFLILRYGIYPDTAVGITMGFMMFSAFSGIANEVRWIDVYGRSHPNATPREKTWPHFDEAAPDANAICFNVFKWAASMFLFWYLGVPWT